MDKIMKKSMIQLSKNHTKLLLILIMLFSMITIFTGCNKVDDNRLIYSGSVEGTEITISSEIPGEILELMFNDGDYFDVGDKVFRINVEDYDISLEKLEVQQEIAKIRYEKLLNGSSKEEIDVAKSNSDSVQKQLSGALLDYEYWSNKYDEQKSLFENGAVSESQLTDIKNKLDKANTLVNTLQKQLDATKATLEKITAGSDKETLSIAENEILLRELEIKDLKNKIEKGLKTSKISGIVQNVNYNVGEYISPGMTVYSIINVDELYINVYVREKNLHRINVGDAVNITEDFLKDKSVKGEIVSISTKAEFTPKNVESKESKQEMVFKTKVKVTEGKDFLKPGMFIEVEIIPNHE